MMTPLVEEITFCDPFVVYKKMAQQPGAVLLESARQQEYLGRYSFIGIDPFLLLQEKNGENPFPNLQHLLQKFSLEQLPDYPPFQGGVMGFFSYDLIQYLENWPLPATDDMQFPNFSLGFYDVVIAFDHLQSRAFVFSSGFPSESLERAGERLQWVLGLLQQDEVQFEEIYCAEKNSQSNFNKEEYCRAVDQVKEYILAGDIFEANISQRFKISLPENLTHLEIYRRLRQQNAAPFAALIQHGDVSLISASPERFIQKLKEKIEVRPIKGTRPRGKTELEDAQFAKELLQSEKDYAENVMIVDLMRNDLSKVCTSSSVKVEKLCGLESFATVHHLVSVVTGELQPQYTAVDMLQAVFPGGSITGAPKLRAMEIISEIEPTARGPYCGCLGYISFSGDVDMAMTIRTFCVKDKTLTYQVGGAITLDSIPEEEYQETLDKAVALKKVLYGSRH